MSNTRAERLVASPAFRWMPGMKAIDPERPGAWALRLPVTLDTLHPWYGYNTGATPGDMTRAGQRMVPDLTDPATVGCLLALLDEATSGPPLMGEPVPLGVAAADALIEFGGKG